MYDDLKLKVATACRILGSQAFEEHSFAGHVSARIAGTDRFVVFGHVHHEEMGRGMADARPEDIITMDLRGNKIEGNYSPVGEIVIHTSVYRARPDVMSIVHCHPPTIVAFSNTSAKILPMSVSYIVPLKKGVSRFDLGPRIIVTEKDGDALVKALGNGCAAIQKGHGIISVGETIEEAVMSTIFIEKNLKLQKEASRFGEITPFDSLEVDYGSNSIKKGESQREVLNEHYGFYARKVGVIQ